MQRDAARLPRLHALKAAPPGWGDRRIWVYVRFVAPVPVHQQRVLRLRREHPLLGTPNATRKAKRPPTRSQPRPTTPHEGWGLEMAKGLVEGFGGVASGLVVDWETNKIVGD